MQTICMKSQILFSGENKKNIINLSLAELTQRGVKVKNIPTMSLFGPTATEFQLNEYLEGQFVNPS